MMRVYSSFLETPYSVAKCSAASLELIWVNMPKISSSTMSLNYLALAPSISTTNSPLGSFDFIAVKTCETVPR